MAQLLTLRLTRSDSSNSWGFRLQGGKDFGTPLLIQKVNVGSLAEKAGLQVGDAVIRVNGKEVADVRHKDAQDTIVRAGNAVEITIQRGGISTWKPSVSPVGTIPSPNPYKSASPSPVTKTSLAATNRQSPRIPAGFNSTSKPFSPQQNGGYVNENGSIKAIVNKQYNTPVGIYSDESIAETLSAQAEVLATGVLGVNFKKNEKNYNAESSEVFKMVLEAEKEPKSPEPERPSSAGYFATSSHAIGGQATSSRPQTPIANMLPHARSNTNSPLPNPPSSTADNPNCSECRQNIVGVFVRIKDKNLHVECFKCATCGTSLKNVGYYSINNKLYCDIHAKMIARQNPPAPNLEPLTISPSQNSASKLITSALSNSVTSAPLSPQPTLAPIPFHPPRQSPSHVTSPVPPSQTFSTINGSKSFSTLNTPKPGYFQSQKAMPFSKENNTKPFLSPSTDSQPVSYYNPSQRRLPFLKPRAEKMSAFMPVMKSSGAHSNTPKEPTFQSRKEQVEHDKNNDLKLGTVFESFDQQKEDETQINVYSGKKLSLCSQEVDRLLLETVSQNLPTPISNEDRPESPVPSEFADEFQHFERCKMESLTNKHLQHCASSRPHSVRSISPCERPLTPSQIVVFPPEVPSCLRKPNIASPVPIYSRSFGENAKNQRESHAEEGNDRNANNDDGSCQCVIERTRETLKVTCMSPIPIKSRTEIEETNDSYEVSLRNLPQPISQPGSIASLLKTAPDRPFTPIEPVKATIFTEPVPLPPETIPYLPTSKEESYRLTDTERAVSPLVYGLTTASDRAFSPLPTTVKFEDLFPPETDEPKQEEKPRPSLAEALTIAPDRCYTPLSQCNIDMITNQEKSSDNGPRIPDLSEDPSVILTRPIITNETKKIEKSAKKNTNPVYVCSSSFYVTEAAFPPICDELKSKFEKRLRTGSITEKPIQKKTTESIKPTEEHKEEKHTTTRSLFTPTGLHKPINLPHYQQCVKELASRNKTPSLSRKNTPTPSSRAELSRKNTPTNFEATVCTQQKIFNPESTTEARNSFLKSSALSFLTETKEISEKIPPVLGYQPGSIIDNLSSYTKVEQCVKTVCEKTLKQIQQSTTASDHGKGTISRESVRHSNTSEQCIVEKKSISRSTTPTFNAPSTATTGQSQQCAFNTNKEQSLAKRSSSSRPSTPISASKVSSEHTYQATTVSQQNRFDAISSPQTVSRSLAASQLSHKLSKTLSAFTSNNQSCNISSKTFSTSNAITSSDPNLTGSTIGGNSKGGTSAGFSAPRRGKGVWNPQNLTPGARIPLCAQCSSQIRGPFITALGKIWCPEHFVCVNASCHRSLLDIGFVEEPSGLHCEYCFEKYLAPTCGKCSRKIKGDCLNAIGKHFHPECFTCAYCNKLFGNSPFFLEEGLPYCENDWNELFTTKCFACGFPIEAGDRWVEALNNNYHSPCFNCTMCKTNLEGQSFYAKGGRPFCKNHAR